jgi:hypothetical protein
MPMWHNLSFSATYVTAELLTLSGWLLARGYTHGLERTDWETVSQRAAGRRKFNELRQALARERQQQVWGLWLAWGDY